MAESQAEWASRNTSALWSFKRSKRDIAKIVVVTAILWYLSPTQERAAQKVLDGIVALAVAYFVIPFAEWLFNAFRAPSRELQWKNEDLAAELSVIKGQLARAEQPLTSQRSAGELRERLLSAKRRLADAYIAARRVPLLGAVLGLCSTQMKVGVNDNPLGSSQTGTRTCRATGQRGEPVTRAARTECGAR